MRLAYHANCWGPLGGNAVGVTSITELTYRTFADMERAIGDIAEAGYQGVELFDGNLLDFEADLAGLMRILESAGLKLVAVYSGGNFIFDDILQEELARIERAAKAAAAAGAEHLVVGGGAKRAGGMRPDDIRKLGAALEEVVRIAGKHGLVAHYHPHLTTIVEGTRRFSRVFKETSIKFCPDTAHLAAAGADVPGADPRASRSHRLRPSQGMAGKALRLHAARYRYARHEGDHAARSTEINYSGWITVELDSWPDPKEGAARSLAFLKA